jgi:hypothetical protein
MDTFGYLFRGAVGLDYTGTISSASIYQLLHWHNYCIFYHIRRDIYM